MTRHLRNVSSPSNKWNTFGQNLFGFFFLVFLFFTIAFKIPSKSCNPFFWVTFLETEPTKQLLSRLTSNPYTSRLKQTQGSPNHHTPSCFTLGCLLCSHNPPQDGAVWEPKNKLKKCWFYTFVYWGSTLLAALGTKHGAGEGGWCEGGSGEELRYPP